MEIVRVELGPRSYDIHIGSGFLNSLPASVPQLAKAPTAFLLCDEKVESIGKETLKALQERGVRSTLVLLPSGEEQKGMVGLARVYDQLAEFRAERKTMVIPIGGGVTGDLGGFAASTFNRGLPLFMIPTTLLAMVDSSVGGKTAINHARGKNLIGAFHQPIGVAIDIDALGTLGDREFRSGLAEVIKYGMILDAAFFDSLEMATGALSRRRPEELIRVIKRSCELKAQVVSQDEREETGLRAILNMGHTFAHAFETVLGYGEWLHGEAVSAGIVCATRLSCQRGLIEQGYLERVIRLLHALRLPVEPPQIGAAKLIEVMRSDKKASEGKMRFILPVQQGKVALFDDVSEGEVKSVLAAE